MNTINESTTPPTMEQLQQKADAIAADHANQLALLDAAKLRAAELQQPVGDALDAHRRLSQKIQRAESNLQTQTAFAVQYGEKIDQALDDPTDETDIHFWKISGAFPGLAGAERNIVLIQKWITSRKAQLGVIESRIAELMKTRGHLRHLLPLALTRL